MHRWLPLGRDLGQTLNAYSYVLAHTHKAVTLIFRGVPLYQITLLAPVVCFVIGLSILCFFLYRIFGLLFSSIVGVLLATLPGVIDRSTAGFSDRDSWCFLKSNAFVPVYPTDAFEESFVKVWEIHYPSDITANLKYLATEPEK